MANCDPQKYLGATVPIEYQMGCGTDTPDPGAWELIGSMTAKEFNPAWDDVDMTGDDSVGRVADNYVTFLNLDVTGDGFCPTRASDMFESFTTLYKHFMPQLGNANHQPRAWFRLTYADLTFVFYASIMGFTRSAPTTEGVTFTITLKGAASPLGIIVTDTPGAYDSEVDTVTVSPATRSAELGDIFAVVATVSPSDANPGVVWTSDNPDAAIVDKNGHVTIVADDEGNANIRATSVEDPAKYDECAVTIS